MSASARQLPAISLTLITMGTSGITRRAVSLPMADLIAYAQERAGTQLWLKSGERIQVQEGTAEIDRLVREAATAAALP